MASRESRHCPHFGSQDGVCGCPEFWQFANHAQNDQASSLQEVSNLRYGQSAAISGRSSSVNSIPLPNRTNCQSKTSASPGPLKETCFFWYHGACRRGNQCDRLHEAHPTWPITPPPGFRHFQPCTLPLCPLRADFETDLKSHEYQRPRREMDGQVDGAAFSRARIAGESSSDLISDTADTDVSDAGDDSISTSEPGFDARCCADDSEEEGANAESEFVMEQTQGKDELDEPDYVDLSQLLSPQTTPITQEETLSSISHPGTRIKRRRLPTTTSSESSSKRAKPEQRRTSDLRDVDPILERPRTMSQWDTKSQISTLSGQHPETGATYFAPSHKTPPLLDPWFVAHAEPSIIDAQPFDPPKGPRGMDVSPPICFFYYHKGYCKPKRGRRCDYLHDKDTSQQTVSLPHGIDNHDPQCSLPLCPIRLRTLNGLSREHLKLPAITVPDIKDELITLPKISEPLSHDYISHSPRDENRAVRGRPPRGTLGQLLPKLTGGARERFLEQKRTIEHMQAISGIDLENASTVDSVHRIQAEKLGKRGRRRRKRRAQEAERARMQMKEDEMIRQGRCGQSVAPATQNPLPSLLLNDEPPALTASPPADNTVKKQGKNSGSERYHQWRADNLRLGRCVNDKNLPGLVPQTGHVKSRSGNREGFSSPAQAPDAIAALAEQQVGIGKAPNMSGPLNREFHRQYPDLASSQLRHADMSVRYEYAPEALGLTADQRRAQVIQDITARHPAVAQTLLQDDPNSAALEMVTENAPTGTRFEGQNQHLLSKSRYHRTSNGEEYWNYQSPYRPYGPASVDAESGPDQIGNETMEARGAGPLGMQAAPARQLPESDQRLDWDTDLVRRLFGEIE